MSLVPAKCPECGGNINIDSEKRAAICEFCKQPFIVEDAINHFNTTYNITNNNEIKADVVNVYENKEKDFIIKAGELVEYKGESANIVIPDSVRIIGFRAFLKSAIIDITIPKSVAKIKERAFEWCTELKAVTIEAESIEVGTGIFQGCSSLESITYNDRKFSSIGSWSYYLRTGDTSNSYQIDYSKEIEYVPEGVEIVLQGNNGNQYKYLREVILPESVRKIEDRAFLEESYLEHINMPSNLVSIGSSAFKWCSALKKLEFPEGIEKIGSYVCCNCKALEEIYIPGRIGVIPRGAFFGCDKLKHVVIGEGITVIEEDAFCNCFNLKSVVLPASLSRIGEGAFRNHYDGVYTLKHGLMSVTGNNYTVKKYIRSFPPESPFGESLKKEICPYCGGTPKGIFAKECSSCGRKL